LPFISQAEGAVMLRLIPFSVVILALILLRLCYVHGMFSRAEAEVAPVASSGLTQRDGGLDGSGEISTENRARVNELARIAMRAPSEVERSAAALATADESTSSVAQTMRSINAAEDVVMENIREADTTAYKAIRYAARGDRLAFTLDVTQGNAKETKRQCDVTIFGNGFFAVKMQDGGEGIGYTRNGNLFVNNKNELCVGAGEGYRLIPTITVPRGVTDINIGQDGTIQVLLPGTGAKQNIGRLVLTKFIDPTALSRAKDGILLVTRESGAAIVGVPSEDGLGIIQQGFLESSNVDVIGERLRLKFLNNWRAALDEAMAGNRRGNVASTN